MAKFIEFVLLGKAKVGKTTLVHRMTERSLPKEYNRTIGLTYDQCSDKLLTGANCRVWDTDGTQQYPEAWFDKFLKGKKFLLVYDITNQESFDALEQWISRLEPKMKDPEAKISITIIANKTDLKHDRKVSTEKGKQLADKYQLNFFEISALTNENLTPLFNSFVEKAEEPAKPRPENLTMTALIEKLESDYKELVRTRLRSRMTGGCLGASQQRFDVLEQLKKDVASIENNSTLSEKKPAFVNLLNSAHEQIIKHHQKSKIPFFATQSDLARCVKKLLNNLNDNTATQSVAPPTLS